MTVHCVVMLPTTRCARAGRRVPPPQRAARVRCRRAFRHQQHDWLGRRPRVGAAVRRGGPGRHPLQQPRHRERGREVIENMDSTDVESPPPPPYTPGVCMSIGGLLRTNTRPTLHLLLLLHIFRASLSAFTLKVRHVPISARGIGLNDPPAR